MIMAATGSKLASFKRVSISSSFRSKEKLKSDHVTSLNFGNTIPTRSGRLSTALLCVCILLLRGKDWYTTLLVQLVIARPAMGEVPRSIPNVTSNAFFNFFPFRVIY